MTLSLRCNWLKIIFVTATVEILGCPVVLSVPLNRSNVGSREVGDGWAGLNVGSRGACTFAKQIPVANCHSRFSAAAGPRSPYPPNKFQSCASADGEWWRYHERWAKGVLSSRVMLPVYVGKASVGLDPGIFCLAWTPFWRIDFLSVYMDQTV